MAERLERPFMEKDCEECGGEDAMTHTYGHPEYPPCTTCGTCAHCAAPMRFTVCAGGEPLLTGTGLFWCDIECLQLWLRRQCGHVLTNLKMGELYLVIARAALGYFPLPLYEGQPEAELHEARARFAGLVSVLLAAGVEQRKPGQRMGGIDL